MQSHLQCSIRLICLQNTRLKTKKCRIAGGSNICSSEDLYFGDDRWSGRREIEGEGCLKGFHYWGKQPKVPWQPTKHQRNTNATEAPRAELYFTAVCTDPCILLVTLFSQASQAAERSSVQFSSCSTAYVWLRVPFHTVSTVKVSVSVCVFTPEHFLLPSDLPATRLTVRKYKYTGNKLETETNLKDMSHILSDAWRSTEMTCWAVTQLPINVCVSVCSGEKRSHR